MIQQIDNEQIISCYRAILGRDPESAEVIQAHIDSGATLESFIRSALASPEFVQRHRPPGPQRRLAGLSAAQDIDVSGTPEQMELLLGHMRGVWTRYGVDDPYYSVLTNETYRKSVIGDDQIEEFYKQGLNEFNFINGTLERNDASPDHASVVLDFGCGLGRVGCHFARAYKSYIGVDISRPHLNQAELYFGGLGLENAAFILLEEFLLKEQVADLIFSVIVLQHNPPPVIGLLIERMCRALRPGGFLLFQVPTRLTGYRFRLNDYLGNLPSEGIMEMHAFPQKEVFRILRDHGCVPIEVFEHDMIGPIGESTVFVALKDGRGPSATR